jgi:alpha-beta hydrolase superfamily lysophospholipase
LSGVLHLPNKNPLAVVVGCHGLMANKHSPKQIELARGCTEIGMAYLRFDHRGCGKVTAFSKETPPWRIAQSDLTGRCSCKTMQFGQAMPIGLFGSSLGGTVCLSATACSLSPFAIVTLAAPVQSRSIQLPEDSPQSLKNELGQESADIQCRRVRSGPFHHILIIHGSSDETVALENAYRIFSHAQRSERAVDPETCRSSNQ